VQAAENVPVFAGHATMVYHGNLQNRVMAMAHEISSAAKVASPERRVRKYSRATYRYTRRSKRKKEEPPVVAAAIPEQQPSPPIAWQVPNPNNDLPILVRTVKIAPMFVCDFSCRWEEAELLYTMDEPEWSMETICALTIHPEETICPRN
jgi:hypothetical protein